MQLNSESLQLFLEGMKYSREQHAEEKNSFENGVNGRLHSRNGKLSFSSIKGTIEIFNDPKIVKYLGYFSFPDELVLFVKYDEKVIGDSKAITNEAIFGEDIVVDIPFGGVQFNFTNQLTQNAREEITTITVPLIPMEEAVLEDNYDESITSELIDLSDYYSLGSNDIPNFEICDLGGIEGVPEYNKEYADAIIILKKEDIKTITPRLAWLGNMNWDINRKITTVGIDENNYYKRVYFTDNLNPLRVFNLKDNSLNFRVAEEFDINQRAVLLQPYVTEITDEGSIKAMSVQYAYQLITENGQVTPFSPYSKLELIVKDSEGYDYQGGDISETTSKSVKIKCPVISTLYKEIQAIAIEFEADTIPSAIRNLGKKDVAEIVEFIHTGNESEYTENFTLEDVIETDNIWTYCNDITTKRNKLIAAGLRNEPYALQEKYVEDMFLFKGWDVDGNTHDSLINPTPSLYNHFDPTNEEDSLYLKKQLYTRFLFFGNTTLTLRNKLIPGSEQSITFTSSSDQYIEYIDKVYEWLSGLDLSDFPNLQITNPNDSILFSPIDELIETDLSDYIFETSVSQVIIDFDNEWGLLEPNVDVNKLIFGAQSYGFNKGVGVRVSFKEATEIIMKGTPELYEEGPVLDLQTPSLKKTFVKDEIYRCSIQFFRNGNPLFAIVLGDIKTPAIGDNQKYINASGDVTIDMDRKYVNQSEFQATDAFGETTLALLGHRLEMEVEVRIPCEFKKIVDSYQIQYVERTENNRTVLCQGISAPLIRIASWRNPSQASTNFAPDVNGKWTLPFTGGPLYMIHGMKLVYDDPDYGENWDDIASFGNDWDNTPQVGQKVSRREIVNRKMFYFDSPDIINARVSDKNISNAIIEVVGRLNTDHTQNLIRSRYPYDEPGEFNETTGIIQIRHPRRGIHNNYELDRGGEDQEIELYKDLAFSKKVGYFELAGNEDRRPWTVNISIFSKFSHYNKSHTVEKNSELLNKGEIIPSAVLGTSYEAVNKCLTLFAQHAYNSSLWLGGYYSDRRDEFRSETGKTSGASEGYPTIFIRTDDELFTDEMIGPHITDPIYTKAHTWEGNSKNMDIDGNVGNAGNWVGHPVTDTHALINIKFNNEQSIYGGRTKYAFSQNVFIPLSKVIPIKGSESTNQSQKFSVEGDFYISLFLRTKNDFSHDFELTRHEMYQDNNHGPSHGKNNVTDFNRGGAWAYGVVLETEVESRLASDYRYYRSDGAVDFGITINEFINSAYFKKNDLRIYNPVPWNFKDDPLLTNILSASKTKLNGDIFDAWTSFLLNDFYELEKAKGIITNVTNWGDEIYAIQEFETNKVNIDTSDFITTESGDRVAVQKGDGSTFTSHDKISNFGTSIRRALAEGEYGFSFFDEYNKAFVKISKPLSLEKELQQKLQELFECDAIIDTEGYYDTEYKETNIRIRTEKGNTYMLSYNELLGVFNGWIEYNNDIYVMFDKRVFAPIRGTKKEQIICPVITSDLTLEINVGQYFTYQIEADNNPITFDALNLPNGVNINKNTGLIYGTIDTAGTYEITIVATNECGSEQLTLVVTTSASPPVITSPCFGTLQAGEQFIYQIVATNDPTIFNATNLPPGLSVDANGLITGTLPQTTGTWTVTLYVENEAGSDTKICDLVISNVVVDCDQSFQYNGSQGTFSFVLNLGTGTGLTGINYNSYNIPDRFRIEYNGLPVADSGYVGNDNYDAALISEGVSPAHINTAPHPGNGEGTLLFDKTTEEPQFATVYVDAVLSGTAWEIQGICPPNTDVSQIVESDINSCRSCWSVNVKVPLGQTRRVVIQPAFVNPATWAVGFCNVIEEQVSSSIDEVINTSKTYTFGIDASDAGSFTSSIITVTIYDSDGTTVLESKNYSRGHGNQIC